VLCLEFGALTSTFPSGCERRSSPLPAGTRRPHINVAHPTSTGTCRSGGQPARANNYSALLTWADSTSWGQHTSRGLTAPHTHSGGLTIRSLRAEHRAPTSPPAGWRLSGMRDPASWKCLSEPPTDLGRRGVAFFLEHINDVGTAEDGYGVLIGSDLAICMRADMAGCYQDAELAVATPNWR
jgi:hypothetical protein